MPIVQFGKVQRTSMSRSRMRQGALQVRLGRDRETFFAPAPGLVEAEGCAHVGSFFLATAFHRPFVKKRVIETNEENLFECAL